jgi:hypothetical protein
MRMIAEEEPGGCRTCCSAATSCVVSRDMQRLDVDFALTAVPPRCMSMHWARLVRERATLPSANSLLDRSAARPSDATS